MTCLIVIPARWHSRRFPGKPLAILAGRPLLARVIDLARAATVGMPDMAIVVATDDSRIADLASALACETAMTDSGLSSGSARSLAAARKHCPRPRIIVNLQGDAPFTPPDAVRLVIEAVAAGSAIATPVVRLDWPELDALRKHKRSAPFSGTTCAVAADGRALWFSKQIIPAIRDEVALRAQPMSPVYRHIGLYGYSFDGLSAFEAMDVGHYESLEGLEQLRLLEAGVPIRTVEIPRPWISMSGIDTPADLELAERLIARHGEPLAR